MKAWSKLGPRFCEGVGAIAAFGPAARRAGRSVFTAVLASLALAGGGAFAATLAGWDTSGLSAYGPSPFAATVSDANVTVGGLTRGAGVTITGTAAGRAWGGNGWTSANASDAVTAGDHASLTVSANAGFSVSFTAISRFDYRRSSTGATTGVVQYQVGAGAFTDITTVSYSSTASTGASLPAIDLSGIAALQNVPAGTIVTFRIVNFGGTGATGTWYIYDVANSTATDFEIDGTVAPAAAINGACGADDGQTLAATAPTNLCAAGTASAVAGAGHPWTWSCAGSGGGTTANCSATIQSYLLSFLTDGNGTLTGTTSQTVDYGANASPVTALPNAGFAFSNWTGTGGFVTTAANPLAPTNVTAAQTITANFTSGPIAGACGAADGQQRAIAPTTELCSVGTPTAVIGTGPWTWDCTGVNGGATANCTAALDVTAHFQDFAPIADAQVVEGSPTTNYGTATSMFVASASGGTFQDERAWLAFDMAGKLPPGATVTAAKLRVYLFQAGAVDLPVSLHGSSDNTWTEAGITWNTQPAFDPSALATATLAGGNQFRWVEFDVTPYVQVQQGFGSRINLLLKATTEGATSFASHAFDTKEFNTGLAPRLRIEYAGGAWPPNDNVNLIHTNDMHSRLTTHDLDFPDGSGESPAFEEAGGAAQVATRLLALKAARPDSLVLDAGDISEGGPLGDLRVNGGMVDYLSNLDAQLKALPGNAGARGIDAIVIGNHDVRDARMITNMQASGLPFIAVNMLNFGATVPAPAPFPAANTFRPYVIVSTTSAAGTAAKVAVLGYLTDDSAILSASTQNLIAVKETRWTSTNADHVKLKDWVDYLRRPVAQGGEGADIVVLLSHIGHRRLNSGPEILLGDGDVSPPDLVVAGHWHTWGKTVWQPSNLNHNTAVVEAASYGQYVGEVQLTPKGEYLASVKHPIRAAAIAPNAGVQALINSLTAEYDAQTGKPCVLPPAVTGRATAAEPCPLFHVVGHSAVDLRLDKDKWFTLSEFPWSGDNAAGQWIADGTVWKLQQLGQTAQLALQSGGGVRRDVKAGPVTYLDIYETYPWTDDQIRIVTLTSADIWSYLESKFVGASISQGWQVSADDGEVSAISYDPDGAGPVAPVTLVKTDTTTTWQVAISEYMFLNDDWISESGTPFNFQTRPNIALTQSIRDAVVEYTAQFGAANPMTIPGPRYVLNTELAGGFRAVVTMVADAESEPYFEGVFVRLIEALPETVARRNSYGLATLVNADGSINPAHEFAETMLYRSHLGFPDGILRVGDIIEVWGEGGFFAGNPQLVDQESVYAPGKEFSLLGHDPSLALPEFHPATASFFDEAHENRLVKFRAVRTGDKTVQDANGTPITVYREGGFFTVGRLPGVNGDMLELTGVQTQRDADRRFRLREAVVVTGGHVPFSSVDAIAPVVTTASSISLTATATDAATGGAITLSIGAVADAQVVQNQATTNFGTTTSLFVQGANPGTFGIERDWLRFDLAAVPAGSTVTGARLKLFQWRASAAGLPVAVHSSSDIGWGETTITWGNQPVFDATALDTQTVATLDTTYAWNVGSHVAARFAAGNSLVSFVAKPANETVASATFAFESREFSSGQPALEVDYSSPVVPGSIASVQFFYRYSPDNLSWGPWAAAGSDTTAPYGLTFGFPDGRGHYQFYSVATDGVGNVQPAPLLAQASVQFATGTQVQTISFGPLPDRALGSPPFDVAASATSGLPVVFGSLTSGTCSVAGSTVSLLATGLCSIAADQPGDAVFAAAPQVTQTFTVTAASSGASHQVPLPLWALALQALLLGGAALRLRRRVAP